MHLGIAFSVFILRRTPRPDNRRIDNRPGRDLDAAAPQVIVHARQQLLPQFVLLQQMAKLAHRRLVGRRFDPQIDASEKLMNCDFDFSHNVGGAGPRGRSPEPNRQRLYCV
jgi:hypothetical protein